MGVIKRENRHFFFVGLATVFFALYAFVLRSELQSFSGHLSLFPQEYRVEQWYLIFFLSQLAVVVPLYILFKGKFWQLILVVLAYIGFSFFEVHLWFESQYELYTSGKLKYPDFFERNPDLKVTNYKNYFDYMLHHGSTGPGRFVRFYSSYLLIMIGVPTAFRYWFSRKSKRTRDTLIDPD